MRDQDVAGKAAVDGDTEMPVAGAKVFLAATARGTLAATDPRVDRDAAAGRCPFGLAARALNHAGDSMPKGDRQGAAGGHIEPLVAAEGEITVLHVQIGMADAAALDAHKNFAAAGDRTVGDCLA